MTYNNIKEHKMTDYSKGKIYKIEPICEHEEGEIYIGSTTKSTLAQRMTKHRSAYKEWKVGKACFVRSYDLFEKYGLENCKIYLLESYPCETRDELRAREGHFIKTLKCVNKSVAGRTQKEYQENNKEKILEYHKKYCEENKEKISEYHKIYRQENREKINEKKPCICGCEYTYRHYRRHCRSKKHQDFILNNNQQP
jgi:hypothetical protein